MSSANRRRRQQNRETRLAASEAARQRARRQRVTIVSIATLAAIVVAVVLVARSKSGGSSTASTTTTQPASTTSTTTVPSAAGKPCVAERGKAPAGAPAVPVKVGPPPKKLVVQDLKVGSGAVVKPKATVTIDYIGVACSTGTIFDSSYKGGAPVTFPLSGLIPGWQQGIPGMRVGGDRLLGIPPALAYGSSTPGPGIAPDETLWFVVHVRSTK